MRRAGLGRGWAEIRGMFDEAAPGSGTASLLAGPEVVPLEAVPVALLIADWSGRVRAVNARWAELSGLTPEESMGAGWLQALARPDRPAIEAALSRLECGPAVDGGESRWAEREGRAVWHVAAESRAGERVIGIAVTHLPAPSPLPFGAPRTELPHPLRTELPHPLRTELPDPLRTELPDPLRTELPDPLRTELPRLLRSVDALLATLDQLLARLPAAHAQPA
jgi:PAS domain S-box-containing protein